MMTMVIMVIVLAQMTLRQLYSLVGRICIDLNWEGTEDWNRKVRERRRRKSRLHILRCEIELLLEEEAWERYKEAEFNSREEAWRRRRRAQKLEGRRRRVGSWRQRRGKGGYAECRGRDFGDEGATGGGGVRD